MLVIFYSHLSGMVFLYVSEGNFIAFNLSHPMDGKLSDIVWAITPISIKEKHV